MFHIHIGWERQMQLNGDGEIKGNTDPRHIE